MEETQRPVIAVFGSLNADLISYVSHFPLPGETMESTHSKTGCGGKGANQAVACAKLSRPKSLLDPEVDVFMIGAIGSDSNGSMLLDNLESSGVSTSMVTTIKGQGEASKTGIAVIIVDDSTSENRIVLTAGANRAVGSEHVSQMVTMTPKPSLLILQLEISLETTLDAIQRAKESGIPALFNPAPARPLCSAVYNGLTHLVMNETEAALLSGAALQDLDDTSSLSKLASQFLERGVKNVVITLGARGAYYSTARGQSEFVQAVKVKAVDTTAAGDTFIGAYALSFVRDTSRGDVFDIGKAVRRAMRASSYTVCRKGGQESIPWAEEVDWNLAT